MKYSRILLMLVVPVSGCLEQTEELKASPAKTLESIVLERVRSSKDVGDPNSVQVRNVREIYDSEVNRSFYCGEATYVGKGAAGWSGWIAFTADPDASLSPEWSQFGYDLEAACLTYSKRLEKYREIQKKILEANWYEK